MSKLLGLALMMVSILSLFAGALIDSHYATKNKITGFAISDLIEPKNMGIWNYLEATAYAVSIFTFLMGVMFLFRV